MVLPGVLFRSVMYDGWVVMETPPGDKDGQIVSLHVEDARSILARGQDKESSNGRAMEHAASSIAPDGQEKVEQ